MDYYFRLYTKVFVSKDDTFIDCRQITRDKFDPDSSSGCFVGVGLPENMELFNGPVSGFVSNDVVDDPDQHIESMINWASTDRISKNAVMFNYTRDNLEIIKHLWYAGTFRDIGGDVVECLLYNENNETTGKIVFDSMGDSTSTEDSPFHLKDAGSKNFLGFNSENTREEDAANLKNGNEWDCALYVIDPDNPEFQEDIQFKTLQLPSVYKPFYVRSLITIDNVKNYNGWHILQWNSNVYNGIGYYDNNSSSIEKYKVGKISYDFCGIIGENEITYPKPTLLCDYYESIKTFSKQINTGITGVEDINIRIKVKENIPPSEYPYNGFSPNVITLNGNADFYTIDYETSTATTTELGDVFKMTFNRNSFLGNSSSNVKYFAVTYPFYNEIKTGTCSNKQKYELNPESFPKNTSSNGFLSLYGTYVYTTISDYYNYFSETSHPTYEYTVVLLDDIINQFKNSGTGSLTITTSFKKMTDGDWHIIGITDPLIDLLIQDKDLFLRELAYGNVLAPHQNFVSIITYK